MKYLDIALPDLQREFLSARLHPRNLVPQPNVIPGYGRFGLNGVIDSAIGTQHVLEVFRRSLPDNAVRRSIGRLSNRLAKILAELKRSAYSCNRVSDSGVSRDLRASK
jgi:hypothetical protein